MSNQDFYEILGVPRDADQDTIKKAYRRLAMQFHPDKNPGNQEAEAKFKAAASAYEILGDPEKRSKYDRFGHAAFQNGGRGGHGGFQDVEDIFASFGDIFGDFFGGGAARGAGRRSRSSTGPARGSDLRYVCEITLKDVINGLEKDIEFDTEESCKTCSGTGAKEGSRPETCATCRGAGQVVTSQGFFSVATTCPACRGSGQIVRNPCGSCSGLGRAKTHRKIRVSIPAGVDNGTQLRVTGEGEGGYRGGPPGDLYVQIQVAEDERFERHGLDLLGHVKISYLQALLGAELEVETVEGESQLHIPPGTASGERLRIEKTGIPSLRGSGRGSTFYEVEVEIPRKLKKEEEKLLREIAKIRGESVQTGKKGLFS
ncbi:MAG: molecular chaperone DnaJ [Bdellovibrionaceae bacterium]|nr:molecular chaperone DnaJ [Pseudobdellovibrionaceae bacterium]